MNKYGHELTNAIGLITLWIVFSKITITMILIPLLYLASAPDKDHSWKAHRHWFWHSIIPCIIVILFAFFVVPSEGLGYLILPLVSISIHCLMDASLHTKGGSYTIIIWRKKRMNYKKTTIWLILQFIGGYIILGAWLVW